MWYLVDRHEPEGIIAAREKAAHRPIEALCTSQRDTLAL